MYNLDERIINERNAHDLGVAITMKNPILLELLEGLLDGCGLGDRQGVTELLRAIADVAELKAAHVQEAWQDDTLAQRWAQTAVHLRDLAGTTKKRFDN